LKFGLIPEFVGRLPILVTLESLDKEALIQILTKPKNALVKQYKKLFELDDVKLEFDEKSLIAIAEEAISRQTGARGLRAIIEDIMNEIMYEIPSDNRITNVIITEEAIKEKKQPRIERVEEGKIRPTLVKARTKKDIESA
jgi:ATP-dependent Clp protease ATP-binding subunit ClpX